MPSNDALLASLLLGQRQKRDPLEIYQSFGRQQMQAGSSTAPLGSGNALEGIARALQGGIGGLMQGWALGKQEDQDKGNIDALTKATTATTPESIAEALKGVKGNSEMIIPVLGQIIQGRLDQTLAQQQAGTKLGPLMGAGAPAVPATPQGPMPQGGGAATPAGVPQPGYSLANNPGNIRATTIPWDGKGAPQNGFETFDSPQSGTNAQFKNFAAYVQANPGLTVAQALAKWAPSTENDTNGYIKGIAEATGINPAMPMAEVLKDPAMAAQLLDAQTRREKGGLPQGYSADTFTQAAGGAAPGSIPPGTIAAPQVAQGSGPTPTAPQGPPTAMSSPAGDQLRQRAQAAVQAGDNVTALKFAQAAAEEDAKWATEIGKKNVDQSIEQQRYQRERADKQSDLTQPTTPEMHKLRDARAEADAIIGALNDFRSEFEKGPGFRSIMGASTPANTAYNNAALLMKGEGLYNLGVLSGPDLDIIRRTLPDPSTFSGQNTSKEEMRTAVEKITNLINSRITAKERAMGIAPSPEAAPAPGASGAIPAPPPGFRPLP